MKTEEKYFEERRSCRWFKPGKISKVRIEGIIKKAMKAPTCGNMQLYSVIVTEDPERLERLSKYHFDQPAAKTAPLILTVCADFNRFTKWCENNDADAGYNNFHSFIMAMTDAVIFAQQIVTVAEMEGLGTCYLGTVNYNAKEISEMLDLPYLSVPVASIAVGVPGKNGEKTERLPLEGILHFEEYKDFTPLEIENIYKDEETNPENEKFVKENGKKNLAQVFSEVRYPREMNEKVSKTFIELLKEKGYL